MKYILASFLFFGSVLAKDPSWVLNPSRICKKSQLCAVGEGVSLNRAETEARLGISKVFKTQIKSKFTTSLTSKNGSMSEQTSDEVEETTNGIVEGVEILKTHETETGFYALAALDKRKAAQALKTQIEMLDDKLKVLMSEDSDALKVQVEQVYIKRQALNERYAFLSGFELPSMTSYEKVFKARRDAAAKLLLHVKLKEETPKFIEPILVQSLGKIGYRITSGEGNHSNATHKVWGEYTSEQQHLKVDGFVKYRFLLNLKAMNKKNIESGNLTFSVVETGRSYKQAKENALPLIKEYIEKNIDQLNIE